jgi:hypothetical protein
MFFFLLIHTVLLYPIMTQHSQSDTFRKRLILIRKCILSSLEYEPNNKGNIFCIIDYSIFISNSVNE